MCSCYCFIFCTLWAGLVVGRVIISETGETKEIETKSSRYDKEGEMTNIISEKDKQEMLYRNSFNDTSRRAGNAYVPFNSRTLSEGIVTVQELTTESSAQTPSVWWKKIQKNKLKANSSLQKTISIRSKSTTTMRPKHHKHKIDKKEPISISKSTDSAIFSTEHDYSNRPLVYYLDTIHNADRLKSDTMPQSPSPSESQMKESKIEITSPSTSSSHNLIRKCVSNSSSPQPSPMEEKVNWIPDKTPNTPLQYDSKNNLDEEQNSTTEVQQKVLNLLRADSIDIHSTSPFLVTSAQRTGNKDLAEKSFLKSPFLVNKKDVQLNLFDLEDIFLESKFYPVEKQYQENKEEAKIVKTKPDTKQFQTEFRYIFFILYYIILL